MSGMRVNESDEWMRSMGGNALIVCIRNKTHHQNDSTNVINITVLAVSRLILATNLCQILEKMWKQGKIKLKFFLTRSNFLMSAYLLSNFFSLLCQENKFIFWILFHFRFTFWLNSLKIAKFLGGKFYSSWKTTENLIIFYHKEPVLQYQILINDLMFSNVCISIFIRAVTQREQIRRNYL